MCTAKIPGYSFEYVPTPLSSGSVGLFIDESLNYRILEKISNEAFQGDKLRIKPGSEPGFEPGSELGSELGSEPGFET